MALLILRESNNAARCADRCQNPQCFPTLHSATRAFATPHLGHVTMPHVRSALALRLGNIPMPRRARPCPAQNRTGRPRPALPLIHNARAAPTPDLHRIRSIPMPDPPCPPQPCIGSATSPSTISGLFQELRNKKSVRIATFLRLRIIARCQNADRSSKTHQKTAYFRPWGAEKRPQSQKSCEDAEFFVFAIGSIAAMRKILRKRTGYHGRQTKPRNKKGARCADAFRKTNFAGIYASLAPYCS